MKVWKEDRSRGKKERNGEKEERKIREMREGRKEQNGGEVEKRR